SLIAGVSAPIARPTTVKKPMFGTASPVKKAQLETPTKMLISKLGPLTLGNDKLTKPSKNFAAEIESFDYEDDGFDAGFDAGFDDFSVVKETPQPEEFIDLKQEFKQEDDDFNPFKVKEEHTPLSIRDVIPIKKEEKATVIKQSESENRQDWMTVEAGLNNTFVETKNEIDISSDFQEGNIKEEDGTLRMYWIDACDIGGIVYLFGKNLERNLYVLPRSHKVDKDGNIGDEVDMTDVYTEFNQVCERYNIKKWQSKPVVRKYAFDLPDIPNEGQYLKVVYGYSLPSLPTGLKGETFSHVFGVNTGALEHFIIKRNFMGPSWLEIKNARFHNNRSSWCKSECIVSDPKDITPIRDSSDLPPPPLCVMSLSLRTVQNPKDKSNEIVAVNSRVYHEVRLDDPVENSKKAFSKETYIRKLEATPFPPGFARLAEKSKVNIISQPSEFALLNRLLARIRSADPDVIVGHNFVGFDLDVLLHRMKRTKVLNWSSIGRLNRKVWPKLQSGGGGMGDTTAQEKSIMAGRLMCDTYLGAKEHLRAKSYSLTNLVAVQLGINREDIEYDKIPQYFNMAEDLEKMLLHADFDTYLCAELMFSLQLLPLSRQLTTLSGNLWSVTLTAGRAVRNEYLLLHEFHRNKYICPDKSYYKDNKDAQNVIINLDEDDQDEAAAPKKGTKRKPQYSGGLVLEPKKGFYDQYVLLLDFNSLYPSIIQEYNICFTTVKRDSADEDALPDYPDEDLAQGILPKLLANLVERRREVKKLMKSVTGAKYEEYNIRQMGLKLTANSMYGCLGAVYSRFYAKQLAMLITSRGREILQNTVDLAMEKGLDVIYGDTDSIMINTNTTKFEEVKPVAELLKKAVNSRYKLLEIEMDGVYQRMLLLKKKKYAALVVVEKNGKLETMVETKGLDMVRRDWCGLSQEVSKRVLDEILKSESGDREKVVDSIHEYLRQVGKETREGLIPIEMFVVNKGLTKNPEDYADAKSQPHVQVALRLRSKGSNIRAGDTVPYVICIDENAPTQKGSYAERAYSPDEIMAPNSGLKIGNVDYDIMRDFEYYLNQQVHPPIDRLCGPIEGTDATRLADCLGLDTSKFRSTTRAITGESEEYQTLTSQLSDAERFKDAEPLELRCRSCQETYTCSGLFVETDGLSQFGLQCPICNSVPKAASACVLLTLAIRKYIHKYYKGWVVCDDQGCRNRTRMVSVLGRRCLVDGCRGVMNNEYSDASLYTQLAYFSHMFDAEKAMAKLDVKEHTAIHVQIGQHGELIRQLKVCADKYVDKSARRFVDLAQLFSFIKV
ncbi:DNA-directed DNA polymerase alpha catalytic subunit pol1, partial [Entomortierella beljakovae]